VKIGQINISADIIFFYFFFFFFFFFFFLIDTKWSRTTDNAQKQHQPINIKFNM